MVGCGALAFRCDQRASLRHPEDVLGAVFVRVFGIGALLAFGYRVRRACLEGVGDVFEEDQAEDDVLVLRRVHVVAQRVGGRPELRFKSKIGGIAIFCGGSLLRFFCHYNPLLRILEQRWQIRHAVVTISHAT